MQRNYFTMEYTLPVNINPSFVLQANTHSITCTQECYIAAAADMGWLLLHVPMAGMPGVRGSPSRIMREPLCTPPGGRLGPLGYTGTPGGA